MIASSLTRPKRTSLLVGVLALAAIFGVLATSRLEPGARQNLLLGSLIAVLAISIALDYSLRDALPRIILAAGALLTIGASTLSHSSPHLETAALIAIVLALVVFPVPVLLRSVEVIVPGSAIVTSALLLSAVVGVGRSDSSWRALFAAAAAVLCMSLAMLLLTAGTFERLPQALCFAIGAVALFAVAHSIDRIWLTSSLLLIVTAIELESWASPVDEWAFFDPAAPRTSAVFLPAALAIAAGVGAISIGYERHWSVTWPLAGAVVAGVVGIAAAIRNETLATRNETNRLQCLASESRIDALTNLTNRRGIDERLQDEIARAARYGHTLSILMIDLDDFKQINDRGGHAAGDDVLRSTARLIRDALRSIDIPARYGGEEFLIVLPETAIDGAIIVAERIRTSVAQNGAATASIGVAQLSPQIQSAPELISAADTALYTAKRLGKNRVALFS